VGISNAYYPDGRTAGANFGKISFLLGTDAITNFPKEFWPDVKTARWSIGDPTKTALSS
jgi:hypothetical protein